jgi:hypothetical protein
MIVYISGPMSGIPENNVPAFIEANKMLSDYGFTVINPVVIGKDIGGSPSWEEFMLADLQALCGAEFIYQLPGWEKSYGARIEALWAEKLGIKKIIIE